VVKVLNEEGQGSQDWGVVNGDNGTRKAFLGS